MVIFTPGNGTPLCQSDPRPGSYPYSLCLPPVIWFVTKSCWITSKAFPKPTRCSLHTLPCLMPDTSVSSPTGTVPPWLGLLVAVLPSKRSQNDLSKEEYQVMLWVSWKPSNAFPTQSSLCLPANVSFRLSSPWFLSSWHVALFLIFKCTEVTPALELLYLHSPFSEKLFSHIFAWWHPGHSDFSWLWPLRMPFLTTLSENPLPPASLCFSIITHDHTWCSRVYLFDTPAAPKLHSSRYLVCCVHGCIVCA